MNVVEREIHMKLDMLESVAKSQRALTRILESAADVYEASPTLAGKMMENLEQLADCQMALTELLVPLRLPRKKKGRPAKPWLASPVRPPIGHPGDTWPAGDPPNAAM